MATTLVDGQRAWSMTRDTEGHREYKIKFLVRCSSPKDGPAIALQTSGLPQVGSQWNFDNDVDQYAYCKENASVTSVVSNKPNKFFEIEFTFSTKPDDKRCKDQQIEDPLLTPQEVSGDFVKYNEESTKDRFDKFITNSAWEQLRGHQVEFDQNRPQVTIKQNVPSLELDLITSLQDKVNADTLWGIPKRCIKLSHIKWERKFYGQCFVYYARTFTFDIRQDSFDRDLLDEGNKVLKGHWDKVTGEWILDFVAGEPPDPQNPSHFIQFKDKKGENCRVVLNGRGLPADVIVRSPGFTPPYPGGYIAITASTGQPLTNTSVWLPYGGNVTNWNILRVYQIGDLVTSNQTAPGFTNNPSGGLWISVVNNNLGNTPIGNNQGGVPPAGDITVSFDPAHWQFIGQGPFGNTQYLQFRPVEMGDWDAATVYSPGDIVYEPDPTPTEAGSIHVEKYDEADFLQLGIPTSF